MKIAAMILGLIGGIFGLLIGLFGYGVGALSNASGSGLLQIVSMAIPVAALIGAGLVKSNAKVGAVLLGLSAVGMAFIFGFNSFTAIPVILTGLSSVLGFVAMNQEA